ncbi:3-oxoacid CoA-transferase subunit A [Romboutsia sp.]|uniref:3-oxoacid CoA-transferase subunit A n=1 Tax=Romboutsia sp. TaxID=1965302 RepID=UPI003F40F797
MNKVVNLDTVKELLKDDITIMIGGFLGCGTPESLIDVVIESNIQNITIIANDTAFVDKGIGRIIVNNQVKSVIASHIGTNTETGRLMNEGKIEVELSPQGTLIERVRAGGYGLGGVLTPTGVGTLVEKDKHRLTIDGKQYLLEMPLRADLALVKGNIVDDFGNTIYLGTTKNFNPMIAMASDLVVVEADEIVECGTLNKDMIMTPGVIVDYIVRGDK